MFGGHTDPIDRNRGGTIHLTCCVFGDLLLSMISVFPSSRLPVFTRSLHPSSPVFTRLPRLPVFFPVFPSSSPSSPSSRLTRLKT